MKTNMGMLDRLIRVSIAFIIVALYFFNVIQDGLALVGFVVAAVFFATSALGFCPLYTISGTSTYKDKD